MSDAAWMRRCLDLARRGEGRTAPAPMAGAVVVREGVVLAEGWRATPEGPPPEVGLLERLGAEARGATLYVNLAPPADLALRAGLAGVVAGVGDDAGLARLREAGLALRLGVEQDACEALNAAWLKATRRGLPRVVAKAGVSLDGHIADAFGRSRWITSEAARADGHRLRDRLDAILIGSGTLLADDPALTARLLGARDPLRVVLDTDLRCPPGARVLTDGGRTLLVCAEDAPYRDPGVEVLRVPRAPAGVELRAVLQALVARGVHSVLIEGGGRVLRAALDAGLVDVLLLYVAPKLLARGTPFIGGEGYPLAEAPEFVFAAVQQIGEDLRLELTPRPEAR